MFGKKSSSKKPKAEAVAKKPSKEKTPKETSEKIFPKSPDPPKEIAESMVSVKEIRLAIKDIQLRPVRQEEFKVILQLLECDEDFYMSPGDLMDLMERNPQCVWGGFSPSSGQLWCCCFVVAMDSDHAFVSQLITHPDHRNKGIGSMVFSRAVKSAGERNLFLSSTGMMEEVLERWGYHFSRHHIYCCEGKPKLPENYSPPSSIKIRPITFDNLHEVVEFDQSVSSLERGHVLRSFIQSDHTVCSVFATVNGNIDGFAFLRKQSDKSMRLSAFYAESITTAKAILFEIIKNHMDSETELISWFSIVNIDRCRKLFREFGLDDPESKFRMMYSKENINVPWFKVYAIYEHYANLV